MDISTFFYLKDPILTYASQHGLLVISEESSLPPLLSMRSWKLSMSVIIAAIVNLKKKITFNHLILPQYETNINEWIILYFERLNLISS